MQFTRFWFYRITFAVFAASQVRSFSPRKRSGVFQQPTRSLLCFDGWTMPNRSGDAFHIALHHPAPTSIARDALDVHTYLLLICSCRSCLAGLQPLSPLGTENPSQTRVDCCCCWCHSPPLLRPSVCETRGRLESGSDLRGRLRLHHTKAP